MAYITADDIAGLYGEDFVALLALRNNEPNIQSPLSAAAIQSAIEQAASEADSYIAARYMTPVAPVPAALNIHITNMACHHLAATGDRMSDTIRKRYEDALRWLRDISTGRANLPGGRVEGGAPAVTDAPSSIIFSGEEPQFKRGGY